MPGAEVIITGTGTPAPDPDRAGAGVLVRHGDVALQFDAGRATVMRLASAGTTCEQLSALFVTHHHSDHILDIDDVAMTRWRGTPGRQPPPLPVVAPNGPVTRFAAKLAGLWEEDLEVRGRHIGSNGNTLIDLSGFDATDEPRETWNQNDVSVSAVLVEHPPVEPAVAYRVDTPGGSVVISGDTKVCAAVERLAQGAQVIVHEAFRSKIVANTPFAKLAEYHADTVEIGEMAARLGTPTLILTHLIPAPRSDEHEAGFERDVRSGGFEGSLVVARDLHRHVIE